MREYNPSRRSEREEASCEATTPKKPKSRHTTVVNRNMEISRVLIRIRFYESGTAAYTPLNIRRRCEIFTPKKKGTERWCWKLYRNTTKKMLLAQEPGVSVCTGRDLYIAKYNGKH